MPNAPNHFFFWGGGGGGGGGAQERVQDATEEHSLAPLFKELSYIKFFLGTNLTTHNFRAYVISNVSLM